MTPQTEAGKREHTESWGHSTDLMAFCDGCERIAAIETEARATLLQERDAAVSARQEAERVLEELREAAEDLLTDYANRHGPQGYPTSWPETHRNLSIAYAATLARTREPAGETLDG